MTEGSLGGVLLGIIGVVGLTYLGVKIRQNQRRLQKMVGVIDEEHTFETEYLLGLADSGQLRLYKTGPISF
jgi:hypothetical protein